MAGRSRRTSGCTGAGADMCSSFNQRRRAGPVNRGVGRTLQMRNTRPQRKNHIGCLRVVGARWPREAKTGFNPHRPAPGA